MILWYKHLNKKSKSFKQLKRLNEKIDVRNEKHDSPKISKVDRLSEKILTNRQSNLSIS